MNSAVKKKFFTVEEANQTLPLVRAIVGDIVRQYRDLHERKERLAGIRRQGNSNSKVPTIYSEEVQQIEEELEKDEGQLLQFVDELQALGVEFKDFVRGLVDFPAWIEGREVSLCWQLSESEVAFWHDLDAGFQGRQSLLQSSLPSKDGDRSR